MAGDMGKQTEETLRADKKEISSLEPGKYLPSPEELHRRQREQTRQIIAYVVVGAYIFLVVLNLVLPFYLYIQKGTPDEVVSIRDVKDLIQAISGVLSGFVSIVGFVVGYYFKAAEKMAAQQQEGGMRQD